MGRCPWPWGQTGMCGTAVSSLGSFTQARTPADVRDALAEITRHVGFRYFALSHHADVACLGGEAIRLHNYPDRWADYYDANALGVCDPVHRASHMTGIGFRWSRIPDLIPLTPADRRILALGREEGIGDGFTVPANIPGELLGSCSFASDEELDRGDAELATAQLAGGFAFEAARRICAPRPIPKPVLTDRQRDCLLWATRGKSDWEISRILGVSEETVARHIKHARERYGVSKRTLLAIRALFDGTLSFTDVLRRSNTLFRE